MNINVPGTGMLQIEGNGQIVAGFQNPSPSDVDRILFKGGTTGVGPSITVYSSTDTNAPLYLGGLGTGVPELIGTGPIVSEGAAYTYGAGFKQTFAPSSTTAGMQTGCVTADPSSLQLGDLWCNSTNGRLGFYTNATHYFAYTGDSVTAAQLPNSGVHTGDVSGTFPATTVTAINGTSVSISSTSVQKLDGAGHLTNASSPGDFQKVFFHIYDTTQSATQGSTHSQTLASSGLTAGMYQVTLSMEVVTASGTGACTGVGSITTATAANSANTITIGGGANMVSGTAVGTTSQGVFTFYDAGTEATTVSVTWPGTCSTSTVGTYNMGSTLTRLW
jgi:hypothetical protein